MTDDKVTAKIKEIVGEAAKLGWVQKMGDKLYINVADVEKMLYGVLDYNYGSQINQWVNDAEREGKAILDGLPILKPRDYDQLKKTVEWQSEILGNLMRGEQCVFKDGMCPFKDKKKED